MRSDIETYLGKVVDSTAKKIAANVGLDQLDVAKELNRMHADGVVEREKRNGNEYAYWLTRGEKVAPSAAENVPTAVAIVERSVDPETKVMEPPAHGPSAQEIIDVTRRLLMTSDRDAILDHLAALQRALAAYESAGNPFYIEPDAHAITSLNMTFKLLADTAAARDALREENNELKTVNARLRANNSDLERRIDSLSGDVRLPGSMFVTMGRAAKPMRHATIEKAQRRASALIRSERESEVLVLEPVGRMVRGSEWRDR
ncbi:1-pyrroline-5-carboxylate dehydrogenase [Burkholderia vietnamiensis]|nr:1-pyrroline-5-carboxylate dehydrogenase [Burkholderia vietnamiensis]